MKQHEFGECCDTTKLVWHPRKDAWDDMLRSSSQEVPLKDHPMPYSLQEALCPECFSRWQDTNDFKQFIHENLEPVIMKYFNGDWDRCARVVSDMIRGFALIEKFKKLDTA